MSGILGIYCLDRQPVCLSDLKRMNLALTHRGADGPVCGVRKVSD